MELLTTSESWIVQTCKEAHAERIAVLTIVVVKKRKELRSINVDQCFASSFLLPSSSHSASPLCNLLTYQQLLASVSTSSEHLHDTIGTTWDKADSCQYPPTLTSGRAGYLPYPPLPWHRSLSCYLQRKEMSSIPPKVTSGSTSA